MGTKIPDILPGHWNTDEGSGMAKYYATKTRAELAGGQHSDMGVAFMIAMLGRADLDFEPRLAMAKDRIRWLSAQLAVANAAQADQLAALRAITFQTAQGAVFERDACITQARAAIAKAGAP